MNPLGADGVNGWDPTTSSVQIIDDGDAGFSTTGTWSRVSGTGRSSDVDISAAGASAQASWSFSGLAPGYYQVATSWPFNTSNNNIAGSADYALYDGSTLVGNRVVSQYFTQTNDFTDQGSGWKRLGMVYVSGGTLDVTLSNPLGGQLQADAVRIARVGGDYGADDDYHLQAGSPAVDRGSPGTNYLSEPWPNGARVDMGAYGNGAQSTPSSEPQVQVLSPDGLEKLQVGQVVPIQWRSSGLMPYDDELLMNAGSTAQRTTGAARNTR